jgi:hypothetical protein
MPTPDTCRTCGAPIIWLWTRRHKRMPVNDASVTGPAELFDPTAGHVSHFATCPQRDLHRKTPHSRGLNDDRADPTPLA